MTDNLITYFTQEEIEKIYAYQTEFAIRNYEKNQELYHGFQQEKYKYALTLRKDTKELTDEEIETFLKESLEKYNENLKANKAVIKSFYQIPLFLLENHLSEEDSVEKILNYIFDFVTEYLTYSEDYYRYSLKTPAKKGYEFDFKDSVPVDKDIEGLLVQGQGLCDDIANLVFYLGRWFELKIEKEFCTYKGELHAINYIIVGDKKTYIDATRLIRKDKTKDECFLVSREVLNKNGEYTFRTNEDSITIGKTPNIVDYDMESIIEEIKESLPTIIYQEQNNKEK